MPDHFADKSGRFWIGDIPQVYLFVIASGGKQGSIRAKGNGFDPVGMIAERVDLLWVARIGDIPQNDGLV